MDGYAVRDADMARGLVEYRLSGRTFAGEACGPALGAGEARRVMTGAPVPPGASRVVMIEHCRISGDHVIIAGDTNGKPHLRRRASDFAAGDTVLSAGQILGPPSLVVAAASDCAAVPVVGRPRVQIVATGDEVVAPGLAHCSPQTIPDSLTAALAFMCRQWGGDPLPEVVVADDRSDIARCCAKALHSADVILLIGGASHGDRDYCRAALASIGLKQHFADVSIRPGKPLWYGRIGAAHILGLPGNPTAALTVARLFLSPLIAGLGGADPASALVWRDLPAAQVMPATAEREAFLCGYRSGGAARIVERQDASGQAMLARTTLLVRRSPMAPAVEPGALLATLDF